MNQSMEFYAQLIKPEWAPPAWIFGPVWAILYALIAISFLYIFYKTKKGEFPKLVALPFALNLLFNVLFTPIQFGLQNITLASLDILLVLATLIWGIIVVYKHARWVTYINLPHLAWVSFATVLQLTILYLN